MAMTAATEGGAATRPGKLEMLANLATILVSLLLSAVLVKVFLLPAPRPAAVARAA